MFLVDAAYRTQVRTSPVCLQPEGQREAVLHSSLTCPGPLSHQASLGPLAA